MKHVFRTMIALGVVAFAAAAIAGAGSAGKRAGIQACGLMPDTKTSVRWEQFDKPYLEKAFKAAGVSARVVNAQGDPQKQKTQADQCIADGAKVLIIAPIDSGSAAAIEKAALAEGRQVDRLRPPGRGRRGRRCTRRSTATTVGVLQGQGVVNGLKANGKYAKKPVVAALNGGQEDANSFLFKGGVRLDPEAAVHERHAQEGPGSVRARLGQPEGRHDLRADARQDRQQDRRASRRRTTASRTRSSSR